MTDIILSADCARCTALCCIAPAFDKSEMFAVDKPAATPCPNLDACGQCRIYASRAQAGFGGCIAFDCLGAGQRVTQELFGGASWMDDAALIAPMSEAYAAVRRAHEMLLLLREAARLPLSDEERARLGELAADLEAAGGSAAAVADLEEAGRGFRQLRRHVSRSQGARP